MIVIDGYTNTTQTVSAGNTPYAVAVNSATNKIYVANRWSIDVTVIDGYTNTTQTVSAGTGSFEAVAVNSATNKIYVANGGSDNVTVIDGSTTHTITASAAGLSGTISPSGTVTVNHNATQSFTVTPSSGYLAVMSGICGGNLVGTTYM